MQQQMADNPAILQIQVVEGEGVAYPLGGRATRGDDDAGDRRNGKPVEGASVSFRLPEEGPSGDVSERFAAGDRDDESRRKSGGVGDAVEPNRGVV